MAVSSSRHTPPVRRLGTLVKLSMHGADVPRVLQRISDLIPAHNVDYFKVWRCEAINATVRHVEAGRRNKRTVFNTSNLRPKLSQGRMPIVLMRQLFLFMRSSKLRKNCCAARVSASHTGQSKGYRQPNCNRSQLGTM